MSYWQNISVHLVHLVHRWTEWTGWTTKARMLGGAGHSALKGGEVGGDAVDVEVNKGLTALFAEEEGAVGVV